MKYLSSQETAEQWGCSLREVQRLLKEGRIAGAQKCGAAWIIPAGASKPPDLRQARKLLSEQQKQSLKQQIPLSERPMQLSEHQTQPTEQSCLPAPAYLTCGLLSAVIPMPRNNPDLVLEKLADRKQKEQYQAELNYMRGDFTAVKDYFKTVAPEDSTYLCAADITIAAAMSTGDYALFKQIDQTVKTITQNDQSHNNRCAAAVFPALTAVCMNAPEMVPDWLKNNNLTDFPADSRNMLVFMRVKYLQSTGDHWGMLATAQTALSLLRRDNEFTLVDIYLTCLCACANYALKCQDDTCRCLEQAIAMCAPAGFAAPLGEYTTWVGGLLEYSLKKNTPQFAAAVLAHIERTLKNWLFFHNEFARDNASLILTTKEYQLALLLKEGKTYAQAAQQLSLSGGRIRNLVSVIYAKLGISGRAEIGPYVY